MEMPRKTIVKERIAIVTEFGQMRDISIPSPKAAKYSPVLFERQLFLLIKNTTIAF